MSKKGKKKVKNFFFFFFYFSLSWEKSRPSLIGNGAEIRPLEMGRKSLNGLILPIYFVLKMSYFILLLQIHQNTVQNTYPMEVKQNEP